MNVTVFGATGGTGGQVVDQLPAAGHHVTAVVRTPGKLDADRDWLTVVVSALGPSLGRSAGDRELTDGTTLIVNLRRGRAGHQQLRPGAPRRGTRHLSPRVRR